MGSRYALKLKFLDPQVVCVGLSRVGRGLPGH